MAVRISVLSVPLFRAGGLEVNTHWQAVGADAGDKVIAAIRDYHGRFLQVHPLDRDKLAELGLRFVDEHSPLEVAPKKKSGKSADNPKPDAGGNTDANKTDGQAAGKKE